MSVKQFTHKDVFRDNSNGRWTHRFSCAMVSTCKPLFPMTWDNYDVTEELIREKVLDGNCDSDTETFETVILFKGQKAGHKFIDRLNEYLEQRARVLNIQ